MHRRQFLELAAAFGAAGALRGADTSALRVEYAVEAKQLSAIVPAPFEASTEPRARVEWAGDRAWFLVSVRRGERSGWLVLRGWTQDERTLRVAREGLGLAFFPGTVQLTDRTAEIRRDSRTLVRVDYGQPAVGGETTDSAEELFAVDFRPPSDWTREALEYGATLAVERPAAAWRRLGSAAIELPDASPDDPVVELDPAGDVTAWISSNVGDSMDAWSVTGEEAAVDAASLPLRYGRPKTGERSWLPPGWRQTSSAWTLSAGEAEKVRARERMRLAPLELIEIDAMISQETHRELLPPVCATGGRPMIKLLGIRSGGADIAARPFTEVWLLAFAMAGNRAGWYAVSHIVSAGADEVYGREAFGYPTKRGAPDVLVTPADFSLTVERRGREVAYAGGVFQGFATGTTLLQAGIFGLRAERGGDSAELVYQHWHYQGRRQRVDPKSLTLELSPAPATDAAVVTDPWHELGPIRPFAAVVLDSGGIQRSPAQVVAAVDDFEDYYRERGDGVLPWEPLPADPMQPSLKRTAPATRS